MHHPCGWMPELVSHESWESFIFLPHVTELQLGNDRHSKPEDATEDDTPSTSGRQIYETEPSASSSKVVRACYLDFCAVCILSCTLPDFCCTGLSSAVYLSSFAVGSSYWIRIISCLTLPFLSLFFFASLANNLHWWRYNMSGGNYW